MDAFQNRGSVLVLSADRACIHRARPRWNCEHKFSAALAVVQSALSGYQLLGDCKWFYNYLKLVRWTLCETFNYNALCRTFVLNWFKSTGRYFCNSGWCSSVLRSGKIKFQCNTMIQVHLTNVIWVPVNGSQWIQAWEIQFWTKNQLLSWNISKVVMKFNSLQKWTCKHPKFNATHLLHFSNSSWLTTSF